MLRFTFLLFLAAQGHMIPQHHAPTELQHHAPTELQHHAPTEPQHHAPTELQHHAPTDLERKPLAQPLVQPLEMERRVFYGTKVDLGAVPFIVSLIKRYNDRTYTLCGASIVNPYWVVTAAHCLESTDLLCDTCHSVSHLTTKNTITMTAGDNELMAHDGAEQKVYPKQLFVHSLYSSSHLSYDIALVRLEAPLVFNGNVSNVSLLTELPPHTNTTLSVAGWGKTEHGGSVDLRKISYGFPSNATCQARYSPQLHETMWCSGDIEMKYRAGVGDSGGPVYHQSEGSYYLDGMVSWGPIDTPEDPIGDADYDVNTNVPFLNTWILQTQANYTDFEPLLATESPANYSWNNSEIRYTHQPIYLTCNHTASCRIEVTLVSHDFSLDKGSSLTVHSGASPRSPVLTVIHFESAGTMQYISSSRDMLLEVLTGDQAKLVTFTISYTSVDNVSGTQGQCGVFNELLNGVANQFTHCSSGKECYDGLNEECDEYNDCGDYSDELNCTYSGPPASDTAIGCYQGDFTCGNAWCVRSKFVCDGYKDCNDGSDESESACKDSGEEITAWTVVLALTACAAVIALVCFSIRMARSLKRRSRINVSGQVRVEVD